jgi:hypothetical protein
MSEGVAYGATAPAPSSRSQPAYGEGRLNYEEPPKTKEHLDGRHEIALAMTIFVPVIALYCSLAYGIYRAASGLS